MKKRLNILTAAVICVVLAGCGTSAPSDKSKEVKDEGYQTLIDGAWEHYDAAMGEMVMMSFTDQGEYSYHCACGEPVGNSDMYDTFKYTGNGKVHLECSFSDEVDEIEMDILYMDDDTLLINMNDDRIEFENRNNLEDPFPDGSLYNCDKCTGYISDSDGYDSVVEIGDKEVALAAADPSTRNVKLAENAEIYELYVNSTINDSGLPDKHECRYDKVTDLADITGRQAFTCYNADGEITKMVFYTIEVSE